MGHESWSTGDLGLPDERRPPGAERRLAARPLPAHPHRRASRSPDRLLVAVAIADQVGAALAAEEIARGDTRRRPAPPGPAFRRARAVRRVGRGRPGLDRLASRLTTPIRSRPRHASRGTVQSPHPVDRGPGRRRGRTRPPTRPRTTLAVLVVVGRRRPSWPRAEAGPPLLRHDDDARRDVERLTGPLDHPHAHACISQQVISAYGVMWADLVTAATTSDFQSPLLAEHATGDARDPPGAGPGPRPAARHRHPRGDRPPPARSPRSRRQRTRPMPSITDCFDDTRWIEYTTDGKRAKNNPGQASADHRRTWSRPRASGRSPSSTMGATGTC